MNYAQLHIDSLPPPANAATATEVISGAAPNKANRVNYRTHSTLADLSPGATIDHFYFCPRNARESEQVLAVSCKHPKDLRRDSWMTIRRRPVGLHSRLPWREVERRRRPEIVVSGHIFRLCWTLAPINDAQTWPLDDLVRLPGRTDGRWLRNRATARDEDEAEAGLKRTPSDG